MKNYTNKDLEGSPQTLIKFFMLRGRADVKAIDDAMEFYKTFSISRWKKHRMNKKRFIKYFLKAIKFYNSIKKNG